MRMCDPLVGESLHWPVTNKRETGKELERGRRAVRVHPARTKLQTLPTSRDRQPRCSERLAVSNKKGDANGTKSKRTA